jgi:hypothetical protein
MSPFLKWWANNGWGTNRLYRQHRSPAVPGERGDRTPIAILSIREDRGEYTGVERGADMAAGYPHRLLSGVCRAGSLTVAIRLFRAQADRPEGLS